ncbi:MAG: xanthine dehydrogenase family protein subunit M [Chloroflexi bacterium]|nr:xanthine dehydrogenase family protein subunit M [Chloroflexota bacterium]
MKDFEYRAPASIAEAVALLAEKGDKARMLAGGTDLIVQLRGGRFELDRVVDGKGIPELNQLSYDSVDGLVIGAAVPCHVIYENEVVAAHYPGIIDSTTIIGGIQIQGRASLGGNLCNASPSGDSIPLLIALEGTAVAVGPNGTRSIAIEDFCTGPGRSALQPGEILVSMRFPAPKPNSSAFYLRFIPRNEMDIAVVGVGASVVLSDDHSTIVSARVALGAVGPTPIFVRAAGEAVAGKPATAETIALAAEAARAAATPISDMRGTIEQRKHLSAVLTSRALRGAIARAKGETVSGH